MSISGESMVQIPSDFNQFEQLEALLSRYPLRRDIMAILAILDWTLAVTTQVQMNWQNLGTRQTYL